MKIIRIILAVLITLTLFYIARNTSRGRPELVVGQGGGYAFTMTTTPKAPAHGSGTIAVHVDGPVNESTNIILRTTTPEDETDNPHDPHQGVIFFEPDPDSAGLYRAELSVDETNSRRYYFIQVRDSTGALLASFSRPDGEPFSLRAIGDVPGAILLSHILMIFLTVFCVTMATFEAVPLIRGQTDAGPMARWYFWAVIFAFLGCYPFGIAMNYYAFGGIWEGVPFGTDATDNKTQLLFVYLLFVWLISIGSFSNGRFGRDLYSKRTLGWFGAIGFVLVWVIYGIPHSIQFSPELTYTVCYSFIGLVLALYVAGLTRRSGDGQRSRAQPELVGRD